MLNVDWTAFFAFALLMKLMLNTTIDKNFCWRVIYSVLHTFALFVSERDAVLLKQNSKENDQNSGDKIEKFQANHRDLVWLVKK